MSKNLIDDTTFEFEEGKSKSEADGEMQEVLQQISNVQTGLSNEITNRQTAVANEESARQTADNALGTRITNETANRQTAVSNEATARANADNVIKDIINQSGQLIQVIQVTADNHETWDAGDGYAYVNKMLPVSINRADYRTIRLEVTCNGVSWGKQNPGSTDILNIGFLDANGNRATAIPVGFPQSDDGSNDWIKFVSKATFDVCIAENKIHYSGFYYYLEDEIGLARTSSSLASGTIPAVIGGIYARINLDDMYDARCAGLTVRVIGLK